MALLASGSAQEAQDLAAIGHAVTLRARVPVLHFFDGFRTSHEITKVVPLEDDTLRALVADDGPRAHRARALDPDRPVVRGTSQNPDAYFQSREAVEPFYARFPDLLDDTMARFAELTGRRYRPFDYVGHPEAERVVVLMGSGAECARELVEHLALRGERVGVLVVRLFRPFSARHLLAVLPTSTRTITVLDRTKEPGSSGEPLFQELASALLDAVAEGALSAMPRMLGGRYGLASKDFTPAMVKAVFDNMAAPSPKRRFTVGIRDDVSGSSLSFDPTFDIEPDDVSRALFFGLGADGTVSANKASIKIIGEETPLFAQGHFEYDSRKAGSTTISHLRFGPRPIRSTYRIGRAQFIAVHDPEFLERRDVLSAAMPGATVLLNTSLAPDAVWASLPREVQDQLASQRCRLFVIDGYGVSERAGLGRRINTVMQICFFSLSKVLPLDEATLHIRRSIEETWGKRGPEVVTRNVAALDAALSALHEIHVPSEVVERSETGPRGAHACPGVRAARDPPAPRGARRRAAGQRLPTGRHLADRDQPVREARARPRDPHLAARSLRAVQLLLDDLPTRRDPDQGLRSRAARRRARELPLHAGVVRVRARGPALHGADRARGLHRLRALHRGVPGQRPPRPAPQSAGLGAARRPSRGRARGLRVLPDARLGAARRAPDRQAQRRPPSAPVRVLGRLRRLWRDAVPAAPHAALRRPPARRERDGLLVDLRRQPADDAVHQERDGRGPAWSNSLFEDNAEFGLGMRLAVDVHAGRARAALQAMAARLPASLVTALLEAGAGETWLAAQRRRVAELDQLLAGDTSPEAMALRDASSALVPRSVWIVGGDGWAYDIGYGGLDHVLASHKKVNVLVLDTEVYSNTGGQQSKATPLGAAAKYATIGKATRKKDLGLLAMSYGHVYVAEVAMQARSAHTVEAFLEAERHPGPSLIIAHSPCIAHGYDLVHAPLQQRRAIQSGAWPLYRFDPSRVERGEAPLVLDSGPAKLDVAAYMESEARFRMVQLRSPERYAMLVDAARDAIGQRRALYEQLAQVHLPKGTTHG